MNCFVPLDLCTLGRPPSRWADPQLGEPEEVAHLEAGQVLVKRRLSSLSPGGRRWRVEVADRQEQLLGSRATSSQRPYFSKSQKSSSGTPPLEHQSVAGPVGWISP